MMIMELLNMIPMWVIIVVLIVVALTVIAMTVVYLKNRTLDDIRNDVYQLILGQSICTKNPAWESRK